MNKKAFLGSYIVDIYAYVIFIIIIIAFFVIITISASPIEKKLPAEKMKMDATITLIRALQTPIDKIAMTPAEIISKEDFAHSKEFKDAIKKIIETTGIKNFLFRIVSSKQMAEKISENDMCKFSLFDKPFDYAPLLFTKLTGLVTVKIPLKNKIDYNSLVFCIGEQ